MADKKKPRAIFLDFGDTLVETEPLYIERLRMSFEGEGIKVSYPEMEHAYLDADWRSAKALLTRKPFPGKAWRELFMAVMVETLGIKANARDLLQKVANRMATIHPKRKLLPGAGEFVELCARQGIRMAVLSNNDGRTRAKAAEVGIADHFELFLDSTIEGTPKPDPEFFKMAVKRMGARTNECLHIGDLLGCDVMGAQAAKVPAAWLQRRSYTPKARVKPYIKAGSFDEISRKIGLR